MRTLVTNRIGRSLASVGASIGWRLPLVRLITPARPAVLIYHSIPHAGDANSVDAAVFERHVLFLKENFQFISAGEMATGRLRTHRTEVLLTFDDGFRNNFDVGAPILTKHGVPALFFIASRHAAPGRYLWFSYLRALQKYFPHDGFAFRDRHIDMRPAAREAGVRLLTGQLLKLTPHPAAMYRAIDNELPPLSEFMTPAQLRDECEGITAEEVHALAQNALFSIGSHTVDHPFLSRCTPQEARRQIEENKRWLEEVSGVRCDAIAYPGGEYNAEVLDLCRKLGFSHGYGVSATVRSTPDLEIPRVGIYSPSLELLAFKVQWGNFLRAARVSFG